MEKGATVSPKENGISPAIHGLGRKVASRSNSTVMRELRGVGKMRGSIKGSLWGLVLGGVGLSLASLVTEQPTRLAPAAAPQLAGPPVIQDSPMPSDLNVVVPTTETAAIKPLQRMDAPDAVVVAPAVNTEPAIPPQTANIAAVLDAPSDVLEPLVTSEVDPPVDPVGVSDSPQVPEAADLVIVETQPAAPAVIQAAPAAPEPVASPQVIEPVNVAPAPDVMVADAATVEAIPEAPVEQEVVVEEPIAVAPTDDVVSAEVVDQPAPETVVVDAPEEESVVQTAPVVTALPNPNARVRINRPSAAPTEETAGLEVEIIEDDAIPEDAPALLRYASPFANPDGLPMISIILVDDGSMGDPIATLENLGFAPTIAMNALSQDAVVKMANYRAAGIEVALQAALPVGAQPADVEVAFEAAFGLLPEAAMLFSDGTGILQNDRSVTAQVMQILAADGRGFVTVQRGLGNALRTAQQVDVAAATVLRDLDGDGQDPDAIVRALDQAAFQARQSGGAVLMGRLTPSTVQALQDWAADIDTDQIVIAPVSAILLDQSE